MQHSIQHEALAFKPIQKAEVPQVMETLKVKKASGYVGLYSPICIKSWSSGNCYLTYQLIKQNYIPGKMAPVMEKGRKGASLQA